MNLYLLQGLPQDEFSSADVLVGEECLNLVEVELSGEVGGDGGDDVAHGETPRVELLEDLLPVALQVAPGRKSTCKVQFSKLHQNFVRTICQISQIT